MPKVSIQICCYNSEKYLSEAIGSVLSQTFKDWELVIVNDGSTDGTEAIVKRYIDKGLPIIYSYQRNKGFASARNKALGLSRGDWIAILDHDDLWYPEKLEVQSESIKRHPEAKLHFANSEWFTDNKFVVRRTIQGNRFETGVIAEPFHKLLTEGCFIDSETVLIDRDSLVECGGFNERYAYIVDYDMFLRLAERHAIYYEDKVLARWRMHSAQATSVMKEVLIKEYITLFEEALKEHILPSSVKDKIRKTIVYHKLNHSLVKLNKEGLKAFLRTMMSGVMTRPLSPRTYLKILQTFYRASRSGFPD